MFRYGITNAANTNKTQAFPRDGSEDILVTNLSEIASKYSQFQDNIRTKFSLLQFDIETAAWHAFATNVASLQCVSLGARPLVPTTCGF